MMTMQELTWFIDSIQADTIMRVCKGGKCVFCGKYDDMPVELQKATVHHVDVRTAWAITAYWVYI